MELRYGLPLQGLILSAALSNNKTAKGINLFVNTLKEIKSIRKLTFILQKEFHRIL